MLRSPKECQRELIRLNYLVAVDPVTKKPNDDGVFGARSIGALNRFFADSLPPHPPVEKISLSDLNQALWPESIPMATPTSVYVDTQSAWLSTKNWAAIVGILSVILPLIGVHLPVGWGDTAYQLIAALSGAYILIKNTWFTTKITAASAKNL